ncbi:hypothetical protein FNV43_RR04576 [Rhamnella rubrinervis]|uniref:Uncharacterized protein n=1 Tax=Rhamnella rubrinervis TaxID=2594499 RepID=A0A8K0MQ77_9ROSA|nr:hypothetical protein FNV43_RR04576 [Rhamnella rubrinervis]
MSSGDSAFEPFLEYSGLSASRTPSPSSASLAVRIIDPNQVAEQNLIPCVEPNVSPVGPNEDRPIFAFQHPIMIKTDIPSIFKLEDMPYLKKRYGKTKSTPPTKNFEKDRKMKEKKSTQKSRKSDPTQRVDPMPDNTVAISSNVIAPSTEETPPRKKQRLLSPQPTAKGKEPMVPVPKSNEPPAYKTNLGLKDSSSIHSIRSPTIRVVHDDFHDRASRPCPRGYHLRLNWAKEKQGVGSPQAGLLLCGCRAGRATSSGRGLVMQEKIVMRSGGALPEPKEMILKFKAGQTSWATPEPSEDDSDDDEASEISSGEDEPEQNNESPEDCTPAPEKSSPHEKDSFDEAMEVARTNTTGPSTNAKEVASASQPNQEEA